MTDHECIALMAALIFRSDMIDTEAEDTEIRSCVRVAREIYDEALPGDPLRSESQHMHL